jgi:septal ring factor EnvC (AmiA/AmiB activator)
MLAHGFFLCFLAIFAQTQATSQTSIHQQLVDLTAKIQTHEGQMMGIEQDLSQIRQEEQAMLKEINQWHQHLMETIDYLRHVAHYSPLLAIFSAAKLEDVIHSTILIRSLTPEMAVRAGELSEKMNALALIRGQLEEKREKLHHLTLQYQQEYERLDELMKVRPQGIEQPASPSPSSDLMPPPVVGTMVPTYGNTSPEWASYSQGVLFDTRPLAYVASPLSGTVAFAGDYAQNQGKMVIIQAMHSHVVLSGLGTVSCSIGETIMAGEPVGRMPQRPLKNNEAVRLYLEVWRQDQTVNPQTVIKRTHS